MDAVLSYRLRGYGKDTVLSYRLRGYGKMPYSLTGCVGMARCHTLL